MAEISKYPSPSSCPIRERTADKVSVGRCYFHSPGDVCPRHGDVSGPLAVYRTTGSLTDELDFKRVPK
jgi:hypothetical protein